jgi:P-type Cu+ transporter
VDLARTTLRRIKINYFWALLYNCTLMPVAAGVFFPTYRFALAPMLAGGAMAMVSVVATIVAYKLFLFICFSSF